MEVARPFEAVLPMAEGQLDEHEVAAVVAVVVDVQLKKDVKNGSKRVKKG